MENALALLIVTTLVCTGMLATWAATSPLPWFKRTIIYLSLMALVLLIPAMEVFVTFILQGAVIATGLWLWRYFRGNSSSAEPQKRTQFSILTLLQVTCLVAIAGGVFVKAPALNWYAWKSVLLIGLTSGIAALMALWVVHGRFERWWLRLTICVVLTPIIAALLVWGDWFVIAFRFNENWPPADASIAIFQSFSKHATGLVWAPIYASLTGCLLLMFVLENLAKANSKHPTEVKILCRLFLIVICFLIALPPSVVFTKMAIFIPRSNLTLPEPNGYDDLLAAGEMLKDTPLALNWDYMFEYRNVDRKKLQPVVLEVAEACQRGRLGLARTCVVPADYAPRGAAVYEENSRHHKNFSLLRDAFWVVARYAELNGNYDKSLQNILDSIRLAYAQQKKGLLNDMSSGIYSARYSFKELYRLRSKLTQQQCLATIEQLKTLSDEGDPFEKFWHRHRAWQYRQGWYQRLRTVLVEINKHKGQKRSPKINGNVFRRGEARLNLMMVELALQAYYLDHETWPENLEQLLPNYIAEIPLDPFDLNNGQLQYRIDQSDYKLYSVGAVGARY